MFLWQTFCKALILLRNKDLIDPTNLLELFFELLRCHDKLLRKVRIFNAHLLRLWMDSNHTWGVTWSKCDLSLRRLCTHTLSQTSRTSTQNTKTTKWTQWVPHPCNVKSVQPEVVMVRCCLVKVLQNFMYTMLRDSNPIAAKISLDVMVELYKRNIWWVERKLKFLFYWEFLFLLRSDSFCVGVTGTMPKQLMSSQQHVSPRSQRSVFLCYSICLIAIM